MLKMLFDYRTARARAATAGAGARGDPEVAGAGVFPALRRRITELRSRSFAGLSLPNPLGIAAGFDKDARVSDAVLAMGCGFAEIGTVTPRPQRATRARASSGCSRDRAVINRLGFNNGGHAAALARLQRAPRRAAWSASTSAPTRMRPIAPPTTSTGIRCFYDVASYFTINISSPNTPGLRDLQAPAALDELLARVLAARARLMAAGKPRRPIVVKLAPDIAEADLEPVVGVLAAPRRRRHRRRPTRRCRARGLSDAQPRARPAACRGARCFTARPSCWRASSADRRAHSADRHRRHRLRRGGASPRSRPAPRCCSSTPGSSTRDRA